MKKKDQEAIAKLYTESTGYNGETNDNFDGRFEDDNPESLENLKKVYWETMKQQYDLNKQIKNLKDQQEQLFWSAESIRNEISNTYPEFDTDTL